MKKFFSRFSNGPTSPTSNSRSTFEGHPSPFAEKLSPTGGKEKERSGNRSSSRDKDKELLGNDRVKSLTAKFEAAIINSPSDFNPTPAAPLPVTRRTLSSSKDDRDRDDGKLSQIKGRQSEPPPSSTNSRSIPRIPPPSISTSTSPINPSSSPTPISPLHGLGVSQFPSPTEDSSSDDKVTNSNHLSSPTSNQNQAFGSNTNEATSSAIVEGSSSNDGNATTQTGLGVPTNKRHVKEQRDASGGSSNSGSNSGNNGPVKSVAFAPSPKKHSQTNGGGNRAPSPTSTTFPSNSNSNVMSKSGLTSGNQEEVSNFAKPTAASSARARSQSQKNNSSSGVDLNSSYSTSYHGHTDRIPSVASSGSGGRSGSNVGGGGSNQNQTQTQSRLSRNASLGNGGSSSRRGSSSGVSDSIFPTISHPIPINSSTSNTNQAGTSVLSLSHGAGDTYTHLPNSIPFTSPHISNSNNSHLRSASPLSFATGSSFATPASRRNSNALNRGDISAGAGWASTGARSVGGPSWKEMTEEDLVMHLGPRERTRQEVLWEIVASEERYVAELEKTKDLYIDALLHPLRFSPPSSPSTNGAPNLPGESSVHGRSRASFSTSNVAGSSAELPIAARFMSSTNAFQQGQQSSSDAAASLSKDQSYAAAQAAAQAEAHREFGGKSPYSAGMGGGSNSSKRASTTNVRPAKTRDASGSGTTPLKKWSTKRSGTGSSESRVVPMRPDPFDLQVPLPVSLRAVLEAISEGLTEGHALLSEALKARYEEQWPLVRSLADVFLKYSYILQHYATYVCHLERALEMLEEAALMERAMRGKRIKKERLTQTVGLGRAIAALESVANERGESGLSIFLSKPFQRLLKYPLLFQNLLFHTDPSTYEFESTVAMVVEVERIVRSIEDEKISTEERDKTRDAFARIEGIVDKQVLKPRQDRTLVEERALYDENPRRAVSESAPKNEDQRPSSAGGLPRGVSAGQLSSTPNSSSPPSGVDAPRGLPGGSGSTGKAASSGLRAAIKSKRSYRRLSDFLQTDEKSSKAPSMGSKNDLWIVRFSDVEIKCQRVGVTALPMASSAALNPIGSNFDPTLPNANGGPPRSDPATMEEELPTPDFASRSKDSKERLKALRHTTLRAKTRNLYKFIGVTSYRASKQQQQQQQQGDPNEVEGGLSTSHEVDEEDEEEEDGDDSSDEGDDGVLNPERYMRQSKLSFSYWGADKVEPRIPAPPPASVTTPLHSSSVAAFRANARSPSLGSPSMSSTPNSPPLSSQGHGSINTSSSGRYESNSTPTSKRNSSQSEAAYGVVSSSHTKPRVDKFASRLQVGSNNSPSSSNTQSTNNLPPKRSASRTGSASAVDVRGGANSEFGQIRPGSGGNRSLGSNPRANTLGSRTPVQSGLDQSAANLATSNTPVRNPSSSPSADSALAGMASYIDASFPTTPIPSEKAPWK